MYTKKQIEELFGTETAEYIQNKNKGGVSGSKGTSYENIFAIYQLAVFSKNVIESNHEVYLSSQCLSFVDDLVIECEYETILRHFQLKNSSSVSWGKGDKSICDDFEKQYILNKSNLRESEIKLVVSCENLQRSLINNIPINIKNYTQVIYFCFDESLAKVLNKDRNFRSAVEYLCAFDKPEPDKIECVATVLLGAWVASDKSKASIMDILKKAQSFSPSYIRSFELELKLDPEVENILKSIEGFTFNISKGFLQWEYENGLFEGTLPYSMETDSFRKFQQQVKEQCPTSFFDELEVILR